jgi:hypothetical protein
VARIRPSLIQEWVTKAAAEGLAPRSVRKYHTALHSIFERALRDEMILTNPCAHTELSKIISRRTRTLTPDEFGRLIAAVPESDQLMYLHTLPDTDQKNLDALTRIAGAGAPHFRTSLIEPNAGLGAVEALGRPRWPPAEGIQRTLAGQRPGSTWCDRSSPTAGRPS